MCVCVCRPRMFTVKMVSSNHWLNEVKFTLKLVPRFVIGQLFEKPSV